MKKFFLPLLFGLLVGLFGFAPSANATEPTSGSSIVESTSTSTASTSSSNTSVNGVSIKSKTKVVSYVQAKGATKSQMKAKKIRLKKRMTLWTSYRNTSGKEVWHYKTYPKGKLLVWGKDGWYHDPLCYNKVKYKTKKSVPSSRKLYGAIKVVKSFTFTATATASAKGNASAKAHAWCENDYSKADAYATGTGSYYASASATGSGSTWSQATARARASAGSKLWLKATSLTSIKMVVKAQAEGSATAAASAKVTCTTPPPPPPTHDECPDIPGDQPEGYECSPPPSYDAPSVSASANACVKPGEATGIVTVSTVNNNDTAVTATFKLAGKSDQTKSVAANSSASVQFTGMAPGSYAGSVSFGAPVNKSATFNVTVNECDVPPVTPPVVIDVTQVNDVDVTNTTQVCATVNVPSGHSGSLTFRARFGAFTTTNTFTVTGQVEKCATYQAPTEVPSGGTDTITYTVTDSTTGLSASDTTVFRINPAPQPPL